MIYKVFYLIKVFFIINPSISKSLREDEIAIKGVDIASSPSTVIVPLLEVNHFLNFHILALAKSFSLRGYEVIVIVCDEFLPACEIKNCRNSHVENPCFRCTINRKHLLDKFKFKTITLSSVLSEIRNPVSYGKKVFKNFAVNKDTFELIINDSVTRHFYGAESLFNKDQVSEIRSKHTETAFISLSLGEILAKKFNPVISLNIMNVYSAWGPMDIIFKTMGIASINLGATAFDLHAVRFNNAELFQHKRTFQRFIKNRKEPSLNKDENIALDNFISNRMAGNDLLMKQWGFFQKSVVNNLNINKNKKNVFLFTNVPWDQGLNEYAGIFRDVMDWVYRTVEYFKDHTDIDIWIKPHPAEVKGTSTSSKSVTDFIKSNYPKLPKNIHLIDANDGISPYNLFQHIDLGIVLTGTLGLEMALSSIPVITAGKSPCYGLGLLSEPSSLEEYFGSIIEFTGPKEKTLDDLRLFCYFYFIHQSFKWPLTKQSFGDNFNGYEFNSLSELKSGNNKDLDLIFDEIYMLVEDFKKNHQGIYLN